jgi:hypothetical protein
LAGLAETRKTSLNQAALRTICLGAVVFYEIEIVYTRKDHRKVEARWLPGVGKWYA